MAKNELTVKIDVQNMDKVKELIAAHALYIKRLEDYIKDDWIRCTFTTTKEGMEKELNCIAKGEYDETCQERIEEFEAGK